jgi:hypothetical protein
LIGEVAQADQHFARELLTTLVSNAPYKDRAVGGFDSSRRVECNVERRLFAVDELKGRIELVLGNAQLRLFVEIKLRSDYRLNQLHDYLQALDPAKGEFLMAVTRNVSRFLEPRADAPG